MTATVDAPMPAGYETKAQVAARFQVSIRTIDQWMKAGRLPFYKIGRTVRFCLREIEAYLNQHSRVDVIPPAPPAPPASSESPLYAAPETQNEVPRPDLHAYMAD